MDADQPLGCLAAHRVGDACTHVPALGDIAGVTETAHQRRPRPRGPAQVPADLGRLAREAVPGQRRQHEIERVLGVAVVCGWVGERADDLEQLDHRAGPAVRHEQRQRILVTRLDVDEVDLDPVDLGRELWQGIELRLGPAPVVVGLPVTRELLKRRQLHALRPISNKLPGGQTPRGDPAAQLGELLLGDIDVEGTDLGGGLDGTAHDNLRRS